MSWYVNNKYWQAATRYDNIREIRMQHMLMQFTLSPDNIWWRLRKIMVTGIRFYDYMTRDIVWYHPCYETPSVSVKAFKYIAC